MTSTFDAAIERCVNLLGDADSNGAICGQIAGAMYMYGYRAIHPRLRSHVRSHLHEWDDGHIAALLRAALLVPTVDGARDSGGAGTQGMGDECIHVGDMV